MEGTALNLRFDSGTNGDPSASVPQFPHLIQAVSYNVNPLQVKGQ
jgi:hypothetical protein